VEQLATLFPVPTGGPWGSGVLAYTVCAILITIYAWDRFNTPSSNRSSTLRALFWFNCLGYVTSALLLFVVLSVLFQEQPWLKLFGLSAKDMPLPAPLIATMAMTTMLPSLPMLKKVDSFLLNKFLSWGAIPAEAKRLAEETMGPGCFVVTQTDTEALRRSYKQGDYDYGDKFPEHLRETDLREEGVSGLKRSEYRFTRVVKLYHRIRTLRAEPRYRRFFDENNDEFAGLGKQTESFIRSGASHLDWADRQSGLEGNLALQELMSEWHERFAADCREHFILLARFLARALLRSESNEADIDTRLQDIGFQIDRTQTSPNFPLNSLTALALGIFAYLVVVTIAFFSSHKPEAAADPLALQQGLILASKITLARVMAIGLTVWLLQKFSFFRRKNGDQPRYFAYLVNGILAGALAAGVFVLFSWIVPDVLLTEKMMRGAERIGILSGILCAAVAFCCDFWSKDSFPPAWYRTAEAIGCGFAMVAGTALLWFWGMAPKAVNVDITLTTWIVFPSALAMMIGACVPHIYRVSLARSAAAARRTSAMQNAVSPQEPPRLVLSVSDAAADPTVRTEAGAKTALAMPQHFDNAA
jgi:hypothetical protein